MDRYSKIIVQEYSIIFIFFGILIALNNRYISIFVVFYLFLFFKNIWKKNKTKTFACFFSSCYSNYGSWHIRQYIHYENLYYFHQLVQICIRKDKQKERWLKQQKYYKYVEYRRDTINNPLKGQSTRIRRLQKCV